MEQAIANTESELVRRAACAILISEGTMESRPIGERLFEMNERE